jgi:hypothetical protein
MAGDDVAFLPDQDWVCEAKRPDAPSDFSHLLEIVRARVSGRRQKPTDRPDLHPQASSGSFNCVHIFPPSGLTDPPPTLNFATFFQQSAEPIGRRKSNARSAGARSASTLNGLKFSNSLRV